MGVGQTISRPPFLSRAPSPLYPRAFQPPPQKSHGQQEEADYETAANDERRNAAAEQQRYERAPSPESSVGARVFSGDCIPPSLPLAPS